jgi:hypothetical protein
MHKVHKSNDRQDKLKRLVMRLATYFDKKFNAKREEFIKDGEPVYTNAELLGHLIITERDAAMTLQLEECVKSKAYASYDGYKLRSGRDASIGSCCGLAGWHDGGIFHLTGGELVLLP